MTDLNQAGLRSRLPCLIDALLKIDSFQSAYAVFIVLSDSAGHDEFQKKRRGGKGVNLHIFRMADNETMTVLLTV